MENKKNMALYYWIVGVVAVVIVIVFWSMNRSVVPVANVDQNNAENTVLEPQSTLDTSGTTNGTGAVSISYADALIKYADRRIQFDKICQAYPNTVTYKDNTGIMIDNRSAQARTIKVGTNYSVKAYGFRIVVLPDTYLKSKTLLVDCDKSQNVATILVQE